LPLAADVEITLEANPGAVEAARFADFRRAGVNRISIGVQSFRDEKLRALGRVHNAGEAELAVQTAQRAGFDNVNIDLMYGLPGDQPAGSLADLERALALGPAHLSWYQLTLEPQTRFERFPPDLPDDELIEAIETAGRALLASQGFERYEVSAYARPGFRCCHNLNYWQFGDYLGIGAGAHGKLTLPADQGIERRAKTRNPRTFVATAGASTATTVERIGESDALLTEFLMNALRLVDGISVEILAERSGHTLDQIADAVRDASDLGWLDTDPARLRATPAGLQSLNRLLALF
jgi:oxygen-independent coproporphyrinogen-3 oxidase